MPGLPEHSLLLLVGLLRLLAEFAGDVRLGGREIGRIGRRGLCPQGGIDGGQSALPLAGLQLAQTLIQRLAHVVLHLLQIGELDGDEVAGRAVLALAGQHLHIGEAGIGGRRRVELEHVSLGQSAFLASGVRNQAAGNHKNVRVVIRQNRRRIVGRGHRIARRVLALHALLCELALHLARNEALHLRAEGRLAG